MPANQGTRLNIQESSYQLLRKWSSALPSPFEDQGRPKIVLVISIDVPNRPRRQHDSKLASVFSETCRRAFESTSGCFPTSEPEHCFERIACAWYERTSYFPIAAAVMIQQELTRLEPNAAGKHCRFAIALDEFAAIRLLSLASAPQIVIDERLWPALQVHYVNFKELETEFDAQTNGAAAIIPWNDLPGVSASLLHHAETPTASGSHRLTRRERRIQTVNAK